ncbi:MAG: riboflavin synthase [Proteobacteria bacterium]|nr:riboflavin synthase [Pseudomonadota bacterium]
MFTGLIERTGKIQAIGLSNDVYTIVLDPGINFERLKGSSIALNGVCLTEVGEAVEGPLTFHVSPETLAKTSLQELKASDLVNLERALRPTDRLGGHLVQGHVDGTGHITELREQDGFWHLSVSIPRTLARYVVKKGSIAIDGVSLTVNQLRDNPTEAQISFMLVPLTWETTGFKQKTINSLVNIEVDMIAKHLERHGYR